MQNPNQLVENPGQIVENPIKIIENPIKFCRIVIQNLSQLIENPIQILENSIRNGLISIFFFLTLLGGVLTTNQRTKKYLFLG